jgi:hypothetical protein
MFRQTMCPQTKSLGRSIPRTLRPLDDAALRYCVPWTWRPRPMCPNPGLHQCTSQDKGNIVQGYSILSTIKCIKDNHRSKAAMPYGKLKIC